MTCVRALRWPLESLAPKQPHPPISEGAELRLYPEILVGNCPFARSWMWKPKVAGIGFASRAGPRWW